MRTIASLLLAVGGLVLLDTPIARAEIEGHIIDWNNSGPGASYWVQAEVENTSGSDCSPYTEMSIAATAAVDYESVDHEFDNGPVVCNQTNSVPLNPPLGGEFSEGPPAIPFCIYAQIAKWVGSNPTVDPIDEMWCEY